MSTKSKRKEPLTPEQTKRRVAEWLETKTTTRNGHWCVTDDTKKSCLMINYVSYTEIQCAFFVRYGYWHDTYRTEYVQSPLCGEPRCLQHRFLRRHDVTRIEDATPDEKKYVQAYVSSRAKAEGAHLLWQGNIKRGVGQCVPHFGCVAIHRLAFVVFNEKSVPPDHIVHRQCPDGHKNCIAQAHLKVGTHKEKREAMRRAGTMKFGERQKNAKLTDAQARELRATMGQGMTVKERAEKFGVCHSLVRRIDRCEVWRHLWSDKEKEEAAAKHRTFRPGVTPEQKEAARPAYYEKTRNRIRRGCKVEKVSGLKEDECWVWQGDHDVANYGNISFYKRKTYAHILSWLVHSKELHQKVPANKDGKKQQVRHLCGITLCCNPAHLTIGTAKDDAGDRRAAGTLPEGPGNQFAAFDAEQIRDIRASTESDKQLADRYAVTVATIAKIRNRTTYKNVL